MQWRTASRVDAHSVPERAFMFGQVLSIRLPRQAIELFQQDPTIASRVSGPWIVAEPVRVSRPGEVGPRGDNLIREILLRIVERMCYP